MRSKLLRRQGMTSAILIFTIILAIKSSCLWRVRVSNSNSPIRIGLFYVNFITLTNPIFCITNAHTSSLFLDLPACLFASVAELEILVHM